MRLRFTFGCPSIWNSDYMSFELRRVDLGLERVIFSADTTADTASPRLVSAAWPSPCHASPD